ncbi:tRNA uridine(34) 5-carboxymethylaminomethyl modification radical SAM/GNAT enzyme Elp3 [Candidatus Woesearchaeota archaeon]|nr:tRNA uridine(34) 5-carboxymethylaminomethyl modification radical SAM/GNAT enzyme Elp3 [Candidatus Woesearchaeota archaeon]
MSDYFSHIVKILKERRVVKQDMNALKNKLALKYKLRRVPTDIEILLNCSNEEYKEIKGKIKTKPTRTGSGVAVIAIMTKPFECPHGKCIMCPGGVGSGFGDVPQSYTGREPATMRGIRNRYDPYLQIFNRLEQYIILGHNPEKIELIVMGGTFPSFPSEYKEEFIKYSFKAMNDFSLMFYKGGLDLIKFKEFFEMPGDIYDKDRTARIQKKLLELKGECVLEKEQLKNEKAKIRCVALCIETRPDYCKKEHIAEMLRFGCTRVELGVQSVYDDVLDKIERGHTVEDSIEATKLLKEAFLKVGYHMMPGLPGVDLTMDLDSLKEIISNPKFRPDALKIYPCMVMKGTRLYDLYKKGEYKPMSTDEAVKLITEFKRHVPEWMRIMRVQRDIPTKVTEAGVDLTNLRQLVHEKGAKCRCIRCREPRGKRIKVSDVEYKVQEYGASRGTEFFISAEQDDVLLGFCRLRVGERVGIRELHVYGTALGIGEEGNVQHKGIGKELLRRAEKIGFKYSNKIFVISGVGAREYYKKLGYGRDGVYMVKIL